MILNSYQPVFAVSVWHSYFKNGICNNISFHPDAYTANLFKRFRFILKNTERGIEVHTVAQSSFVNLLHYISTATGVSSFRFVIMINNLSFSIITQLPIDWAGQLIYNTQSDLNVQKSDNIPLKAVLSKNGATDYAGTLTVHFDDITRSGLTREYAQFRISFEARSTIWQYYIINNTGFPFSNLSIPESAGISFSNPVSTVMQNDQPALLLSSQILIPLSQEPQHQFNLICSSGAINKTKARALYKGLPTPDPTRFELVSINGEKQVSSPMHVYL